MKPKKIVRDFWRDIDSRKWDNLKKYFSKNAEIIWHNTSERFNAEGFAEVCGECPISWRLTVERVLKAGDIVVSVVRVANDSASFHLTSFFTFKSKKIASLEEYWGEDGRPRLWRVKDSDDDEGGTRGEVSSNETPVPDEPDNGAPTVNEKSAWTRLFFPNDAP
jgi:hypothetical protein